MKFIRALLCILHTSVTAAQIASTAPFPAGNRLGRVNAAVAYAKAKGVKSVVIAAPLKMPTGLRTIAKAAEKYSFLVVEPISAKTLVRGGDEIDTWYLLSIVAILRVQSVIPEWEDPPAPSSVALPTSHQLLMATIGGQVTIDGIEVREQFDKTPLTIGSKYFLIVHLQANGKSAAPASLDSIFELDADLDTLKGTAPPTPLTKDVESSYHSSLMAILRRMQSLPQK